MNKAYLSKLAYEPLTEYLRQQGYELHFMTGENSPVYDAVKPHADIHMCRLGVWEKPEIFMGNPAKLRENYPGNIRYNAICTGKYFIHNLKHTDPELIQHAMQWHKAIHHPTENATDTLVLIDVPQGYTRCCCLPVDDSAFITSDMGIAKALAAANADVLLIEKGHIFLPGFDYGFIGGCAGHLISATDSASADAGVNRIILFNGDLSCHPAYWRMDIFLREHNVTPVFFEKHPLTDIGSILTT